MNQIGYLIGRSAKYYKDRIAVIEEDDTQITFKEVHEKSNSLARGLYNLGLKKGDRVAVMFFNCIDFVIADFALAKGGLVRVPINPRLAETEIEYMLNDIEAKAIICNQEFLSVIQGIRPKLPHLEFIILDEEQNDGLASIEQMVTNGSKEDFVIETEDHDIFQILYTSGTTGKPKGAVISYRSRMMTINNVFTEELHIEPTDRMLHVASLTHGSGSKVLPHFIKGATNILLKNFSPETFYKIVEKHKVTTTWIVPTIIRMLLDYKYKDNYSIGSMKTILVTASPISKAMLLEAIDFFGPIFVQVYALTEAPNPVLVLPKTDLIGYKEDERFLKTTGREVTNVQVQIVNDSNQPVKNGEVGEIVIKGDNVMTGYWNRPVDTDEVLIDGWLYTGDLGYQDDDGYYYIVGRKKDMIISGGYNIYAREIEDVIYQIDGVKEVAAFGVKDPVWGESVAVSIVKDKSSASLTIEDILLHCKQFLAGYKKPKIIEFCESLPKNANGKIDKNKLKQLIKL